MSAEPNRREFLQTAAVAVGSLFLPAGLLAKECSWFVQTETGESWPVADPVSWCLENANHPLLVRAKDRLSKLTTADKDRIVRLVVRRCKLNLIEILPGQVVIDHWGQQGRGDLRSFFKAQGLARRDIEVVAIDRKKETSTVQSGDDFLFGERLPDDWPTELYQTKWERRFDQEPDDNSASPKSKSGFAWDEVESGRIPWFAIKSAWRGSNSTCPNCDQPSILTNFGMPWIGLFQRKRIVEHVCLKCRRVFEDSVSDFEQWMAANLDAEVLPQFVMQWNQRVKWDRGNV
jgi:hypothetical protein